MRDDILVKVTISKKIVRMFFLLSSRRAIICAILIACFTLYNPIYLMITKPHLAHEFTRNLIISIISLILVFGAMSIAVIIKLKSYYRDIIDTHVENLYSFDSDGFIFTAPNKQFTYKWQDVFSIKEHKEFFLIRTQDGKYIIPHGSFINDEDIYIFKRLLSNRVDFVKLNFRQ